MAKIKLPEKPGGMLLFWIQLIRTYRDLRKKIELEVVHISLKRDVSLQLKHNNARFNHSYNVWVDIQFLENAWEINRGVT